MTPEGRVKEAIKRVLKHYGVYWHCPVQNGMGSPTLDFICCYRGRFIAIEAKAPRGKLSDRQKLTISDMLAANAKVFVITGVDEVQKLHDYFREDKPPTSGSGATVPKQNSKANTPFGF